jgi:hypothetical protein
VRPSISSLLVDIDKTTKRMATFDFASFFASVFRPPLGRGAR